MKRQTLAGLIVAAAVAISITAPATTAAPARNDGLVQVPSRTLDEVYFRPDANLKSYRKVIVDPATVSFRKNWLKDVNSTRGPSRWILQQDVKEITDTASAGFTSAVADSFRSRGYEIVTTPGPGVLRVTPQITDLNINAPDVSSSYMQALFNNSAGDATLTMDIRDAATGTLLGQVVDRGTARQLADQVRRQFTLSRTFAVTNAFWFDTLAREWTANCIASLEAGNRPG